MLCYVMLNIYSGIPDLAYTASLNRALRQKPQTETVKSGKMFTFLSKACFLHKQVQQNSLTLMFSIHKALTTSLFWSKELLDALKISHQRFLHCITIKMKR